jgi:protein gp37
MIHKTKIEWCDYTVNPVKGVCQHQCPYCYAKRMYHRFKWNPEIRLDYFAFEGLNKIKIVADGGYSYPKVFIGSTHDIFGEWIPTKWIDSFILKAVEHPKLIFIFLTKNPKRYSEFDFPKNAWLGYSTTGTLYHEWDSMHKNNVKFISIEPMVGEMTNTAYLHDTDWIIIGQETGNRKEKHIVGSEELLTTINIARKEGIKLFVKDSLKSHFDKNLVLSLKTIPQEFPKEKI